MFVAKQQRFFFFSFIFDSLGLTRNINKCRHFVKKIMFNVGDSSENARSEDIDINGDFSDNALSFISLNDNIRRAWSADNLADIRFCTGNWSIDFVPWCVNQNWTPSWATQPGEYLWNNGLHSVWNQQPTDSYGHLYRGLLDSIQDNSFLYGRGPPPPPPDFPSNDILFNNMHRRYSVTHNNEERVPRNITLHPKVLKVLSKRYWENVGKRKKPLKPGFEFTVMSYNVLAQDLLTAHYYLYKNSNPKSLDWNVRSRNLFNEIKNMMPDVSDPTRTESIMCLQEVQESHLSSFFSKFESLGYKGIYKKRTGVRCDGCAIYYKMDKLKLVEYETVEFYQPNVDILNRDNVAIVAKFSPLQNPQTSFVVATTHLLYNPKRQDVRLAQTQLLLSEIERLSFHQKSENGAAYWPIIITGDFNSSPVSAVYELITQGILRYNHLTARKLDRSKSACQGNILVPRCLQITDSCQHAGLINKRQTTGNVSRKEEAALIKLHHSDRSIAKISSESIAKPDLFCSGTLKHLFAFKSVYDHGSPDNVEGTTFQDKWITVDYIFFSGKKRDDGVSDDKLQLISRYRLLRRSELGTMRIPNSAFGSDHLSLVAKFKLKV